MYKKIVLAIPHSVGEYDKSGWSGDIKSSVDRWTDWHTDRLFHSPDERVVSVVGSVSRFDTDLERLINDRMDSVGQGIRYVYAPDTDHTRPYNEIAYAKAIAKWGEYREQIISHLVPDTLLIDCHSFPSDLVSGVDVCIGFNSDDTRPVYGEIDIITNHFRSHGYSVAINHPYSNAIAPQTDIPYKSVMIELNKALYMNEKTLQEDAGSYKVHNVLNALYNKLLTESA